MDEEAVRTAVERMLTDAESFVDEEIAPQHAEATRYYQGQPFGNEEENRSKVVITETRDVVTAMLPSLMRAFFGPERIVEFAPTGAEDVAQAEQETDYINDVVIALDNPGFLHFYAWFKDALLRAPAAVKWWADESVTVTAHRMDNLSEQQMLALLGDETVILTGAAPHRESVLGVPMDLYDVEFRRRNPGNVKIRFAPLPGEEFIYSRDARSRDEATIVAHRMERTTSELIAIGIDPAVIAEHGGRSTKLRDNEEAVARNPEARAITESGDDGADDESPDANDKHDYYETYPYLDVDGDGIAELRMICLLGPGKHVVKNVPADERPFAILVPDPEPHTIVGLSVHDLVADLQRISSFVFRNTLDSLSLSLNPRQEVVEDQVTMADVLNTDLGAPIRVRQPNMVRPLTIPFVGAEALAVMEFVQGIKENRTGITRAAAGLDPDALQSSTKAAVAATVTAAQQRIELFARIFAETGVKDLMRGLRRLLVKHQPRARIAKLRGTYVEVDPRTWEADRDVRVNVALGLGFAEQKLQVLGAIAAEQKDWLEKLGPANPLVGLGQYRATMARILKLQGYPNADEFFAPIPPDWQPPAAPQPPPDPALLVAQAEVQKAQAEIERKQLELQQKQIEGQAEASAKAAELAQRDRELQMEDDRERDKMEMDFALKRIELELKYATDIDAARIKAASDVDREAVKARATVETAAEKAASAPAPAPAKESAA